MFGRSKRREASSFGRVRRKGLQRRQGVLGEPINNRLDAIPAVARWTKPYCEHCDTRRSRRAHQQGDADDFVIRLCDTGLSGC